MADLFVDHQRRETSPEFLLRCVISVITGTLTQLSLLVIPNLYPSFSLFPHLLLSAIVFVVVIGITQFGRRIIGLRASAPTFVLFHLIFIWTVYIFIIRPAVSTIMDVILNAELAMLLIGFVRMLASDPGFVHHASSSSLEDSVTEDGAYAEELTFSARNASPSNEAAKRTMRFS